MTCAKVREGASPSAPTQGHCAICLARSWLKRYGKLREHQQEVAYNMGRAYHHVGLLHLAVPWYVQALCKDERDTAGEKDASSVRPASRGRTSPTSRGPNTVAREAAHNLARICQTSGSPALSRLLVRKYMAID